MGFPGTIWAESEFDGEFGTCGPCSGGMAECWAEQKYIGQPTPGKTATTVFYDRMRANGLCDPSGVTTAGKIRAQLEKDGFKTDRWNGGTWLAFMKAASAAPAVSVVLFEEAHVLRDELTGAGMDAGSGLRGHFVMASEYHPGGFNQRAQRVLPVGFFCSDGDSDITNPVVNGHRTRRIADHRLVFYSVATLTAADIVDVVSVYPKVSFTPTLALPAGWHDDGAALTTANGVPVVLGFRQYVLAQIQAGKWQGGDAYVPEYGDGAGGSVQEFAAALLLWNPQDGVREGTMADALRIAAHEHQGKVA